MKNRFCKYTVLILDRQELFKRVSVAMSSDPKNLDTRLGFAVYKTEEEMQGFTEWKPFLKPCSHRYENEFRFTFVNNTESPSTIDLGGNIRDIAVPIDAEDLYTDFFMKDEKLYYPIKESQ